MDLSTASYDTVSLSTSTQDGGTVAGLSFNGDGTKMYVVGYDNDSVYQYKLSTSFDLSTASYDNVSFSVASQDTTPRSVVFNGDGTKMYIGGDTNNTLYQYSTVIATASLDLSTGNYFNHTLTENTEFPLSNAGDVQAFQLEVTGGAVGYDLASASYDSVSFSVLKPNRYYARFRFGDSGSKVYVASPSDATIYQYNLSTAYDISTASYASKSFLASSQSASSYAVDFKSDGTKMYILAMTNDSVYQYSLSTAWDVSTASYDSVSFSVNSQEATPAHVEFKVDGTSFYVVGVGNDTIYQYDMTTAWDLSTASYASKSMSTGLTNPYHFTFKQMAQQSSLLKTLIL